MPVATEIATQGGEAVQTIVWHANAQGFVVWNSSSGGE